MHGIKKAFTLVELIVVIVILAILATIAFLSFSSQSASARDSTRLSDMSNIAKGLSVFSATAGNYPKPDSYISLTVSGNSIGYQGKAGNSVLGMIKISNGGKDPLDNSSSYTYSVNYDTSKFQILGFLEDGSSSALGFNPFKGGSKSESAFATDYSKRFIVTKGDGIGILLSSGTLDPAENKLNGSFTGVDIALTVDVYTIQFDKSNSISGTGNILKSGIISTNGLVGYWGFDEGIGSTAYDKSGNNNSGTFSGANPPVWANGKTGGGLSFTGIGFVNIPYSQSLDFSNKNNFTINAWYLTNDIRQDQFIIYHESTGYSGWLLETVKGAPSCQFGNGNQLGVITDNSNNSTLGTWNLISAVYDGNSITLYKNGNNVKSMPFKGTLPATTSGIGIGQGNNTSRYWNGLIDEVRIYNRALSNSEIKTLYNAFK